MPYKSAKQRRMIHAAAAGKSSKMSKKAAKKFIKHSKGKKTAHKRRTSGRTRNRR